MRQQPTNFWQVEHRRLSRTRRYDDPGCSLAVQPGSNFTTPERRQSLCPDSGLNFRCEARLAVDVRRGSSSYLTGEGAVRRNEQPVRAPRNRLEEFLEDEILQEIGGPGNLNLIEHKGSSLHHRRNRVRELRAHHPQQDRGPDTDREGTGRRNRYDRLRIALKRSFGHSADGLLLHMRCRRCRRMLLHFAQQASRLPFSFPPEFAFSGSFSNRFSGRQIAGTPAMTLVGLIFLRLASGCAGW